ncbi:Polysaccharide deacetylase [Bosea sp. 62]|uniref:polysaccharide deacetylase family protein n=1 Tax=unclassified Bosea (in: a-proteobacteria) TaxID=2653178 RepID=UPI00125B8DB2|nr:MULTISPECIES: polysaccharide deacetylase family protein [unclassified Bosea (in: a-proteobacteria)]CAD5255034.1 Polysaccharide deacetylase [Bosea sp. 21B]CAD5285294.1 Polysaccharide deacetylase [Bosea sp. 7B]CAD5301556.1 Polysaccharide deacetylase [Bosea sp. 46]VVT57671.1 Polysaccharide deacetylase [Bosea sp. EC-HK365B]VXB29236.1 Polysaccharide deacetylase [Bosea sp. 29B]
MSLRHKAFSAAFTAIAATGADRWGRALAQGKGAILTLHHVRPTTSGGFRPNGLLEITPGFLDRALTLIRAEGYDIVSLDEALVRLADPKPGRFFVALTFDDGYRDNLDHAWPVLAKHQAPWTLYVVRGFAEHTARLWWLELEEAIRALPRISVELTDGRFDARAGTEAEKQRAFDQLYWRLRKEPEAILLSAISDLGRQAGIDPVALVERECLPTETLRSLAGAPGVTIGAHTLSHPMLAKHPEEVARREVAQSKAWLEEALGAPVRHFAYPVGDPTSAGPREFALAKEVEFVSAVTTRPGHLFAEHIEHPHALPRVSLNGLHQSEAALRALLSGLPFLLWNRGRKVSVS